jgi:hypothetical protein
VALLASVTWNLAPPKSVSTGNEFIDELYRNVVEIVRVVNLKRATSDRILRGQVTSAPLVYRWAAAGSSLTEVPIFEAPYPLTIRSIRLVFGTAIAASAVDYRDFIVVNRMSGNVRSVSIASHRTNNVGFTQWVGRALTLNTNADLLKMAPGDVLTIEVTAATGSSPLVENGCITIDYDATKESATDVP